MSKKSIFTRCSFPLLKYFLAREKLMSLIPIGCIIAKPEIEMSNEGCVVLKGYYAKERQLICYQRQLFCHSLECLALQNKTKCNYSFIIHMT